MRYKSLPFRWGSSAPSPVPAPPFASEQDTSDDMEVIEVHLPTPIAVYPVVPFEHTIGSHANAAASAHLLAELGVKQPKSAVQNTQHP